MQIPSWTIDEMLAEKPCEEYTRARLEELWAGRERLTLLDMLDLDIHVADKVWACCRDTPLREPWLFGRVLTRCIRDHARNCSVPTVRRWAKRWLSGEDRSAYAADASADAAWADAAAYAATDAADAAADAAWAAADAAAYAACAAARAAGAAWSAAYAACAAARAAERAQQVQDMREVIAEMCEED